MSMRKAREAAFSCVYASLFTEQNISELIENFRFKLKDDEKNLAFKILSCVATSGDEIRQEMNAILKAKQPALLTALLFASLAELLCEINPPSVVISEWVEIAKTFGERYHGKVVHAVLDRVLSKKRENRQENDL